MIRRLLRSTGVLLTSTGLTFGGIVVFADPAFAACTINIGVCSATCNSSWNSGWCKSGTCDVNYGVCAGGNCKVNYGYCGPGCMSDVNYGICGNLLGRTCTGTGSATLGSGIAYFPTVSTNVSFTFTFNCVEGGTITGSGVLDSASCGRSNGTGSITGIGDIAIQTAGSMLTVSGSATGGGNATPIPDTSTVPFGNSCSSGTAKNFTLEGTIVW